MGAEIFEPYAYDAHGNMTSMLHLPRMTWDFKDQLQATARQAATSGSPQTTFYVYDSGGQRARKVTEAPNGARKDERAYLGSFEIFRKYGPAGTVMLERETLHVMDDKQRIALAETRTLDTGDSDPAPQQLIRYQFDNHLGSACSLELDDTAQIISYEEYYPYGSTSYQAVNGTIEVRRTSGIAIPARSVTRRADCATTERATTSRGSGGGPIPDPAGPVDGANLYWFVRNSPVVLSDPSGAFPSAPVIDLIEEQLPKVGRARASCRGRTSSRCCRTCCRCGSGTGRRHSRRDTFAWRYCLQRRSCWSCSHRGCRRSATVSLRSRSRTRSRRAVILLVFTTQEWESYSTRVRGRLGPLPRVPCRSSRPRPIKNCIPDHVRGRRPGKSQKRRRENKKPKLGRIYVTYQKFNHATGLYYSGRTSMVVDLKKPLRPQALEAIALRNLNHHIDYDENEKPQEPELEPADLDKFDVGTAVDYADRYDDLGYKAIRGREQMLIDYRGGAHPIRSPVRSRLKTQIKVQPRITTGVGPFTL